MVHVDLNNGVKNSSWRSIDSYQNKWYNYTIKVGQKVVYTPAGYGNITVGILLSIEVKDTKYGLQERATIQPIRWNGQHPNTKNRKSVLQSCKNIMPFDLQPEDERAQKCEKDPSSK